MLSGRHVKSASAGIRPSSFWRANVCWRKPSQLWSNLPLYFATLLARGVGIRIGRSWREVREEGLVGRHRLLLLRPQAGAVGQVGHEVVARFGRPVRLDGSGAFVQCRVVLVVFAADETVEVLETAVRT